MKAKPKKDSACCPACNAVDDEDMPVVVAAESSGKERIRYNATGVRSNDITCELRITDFQMEP